MKGKKKKTKKANNFNKNKTVTQGKASFCLGNYPFLVTGR